VCNSELDWWNGTVMGNVSWQRSTHSCLTITTANSTQIDFDFGPFEFDYGPPMLPHQTVVSCLE
jgi:hypothetical protein